MPINLHHQQKDIHFFEIQYCRKNSSSLRKYIFFQMSKNLLMGNFSAANLFNLNCISVFLLCIPDLGQHSPILTVFLTL